MKLKKIVLKFKNIIDNKEALLMILYSLVIAGGLISVSDGGTQPVFSLSTGKHVIMIDAGHGGWDPGKNGESDTVEKDINLKIAAKLQTFLELSGSFVVTTRSEDVSLGDTKQADLKERLDLTSDLKAELFISIHQNSYPDGRISGAQAFYHGGSAEAKRLAELVQDEIRRLVDSGNKRSAMANSDYYLLKNTDIPSIIVECGFLSNKTEAAALSDDEYQEKIAWAIFSGIVKYYGGE